MYYNNLEGAFYASNAASAFQYCRTGDF